VSDSTFDDLKALVLSALGIEDRAAAIVPSTPLLGALPEFDSMAVVEVVVQIEQRFGIQVADDDITGEVFETFGTLSDFVAKRRA
jgi:acyl carrier protein